MSNYIYSIHDGGAELLDGKGWIVVTERIGPVPITTIPNRNYTDITNLGCTPIVRLNNDYGQPNGTIPLPENYDAFASTVRDFVSTSVGCHHWIIGNEQNFTSREAPHQQLIDPRMYATCFTKSRDLIKSIPGHENDIVITGALGNWNGEAPYMADIGQKYGANAIAGGPPHAPYNGYFGDYVKYLRDLLSALGTGGLDGIGIHTYSHGWNPQLIWDDTKMGWPFNNYNYHFKSYVDFMNVIKPEFQHLPVFCTETNGDDAWPNDSTSGHWIDAAYEEINWWNMNHRQQINCLTLYRYFNHDKWGFEDKGAVKDGIRQAVKRERKHHVFGGPQ